jgi:glycosyltransferase involved in cell wall biosynthesis
VPPGDAGALAAALDAVLDMDAAERATLGARARASVQRNYTVAAMQEATIAVYREVMGAA